MPHIHRVGYFLMAVTMLTLAFLIAAYLIGSLSTAIIVCKIMNLPDPRTVGSKNAGATNVLRFADKKIAILVLLGDAVKGLAIVLLARYFLQMDMALGFIALSAVVGHVFPIYFGFKGGKGVATGLGSLLGLSWPIALIAVIVWLVMAKIFRYSSLAALTATLSAPISCLFLANRSYFIPIVLMCLLLIWKHRNNISRLLAGSEPKVNRDKP